MLSQQPQGPPRPNSRPRVLLGRKCWVLGVMVMIFPILAWPLLDLFVIGGCTGGKGAGIDCPPILGIQFHAVPTDLLLFSVGGLGISIPLGLVLLMVCRAVARKRENSISRL